MSITDIKNNETLREMKMGDVKVDIAYLSVGANRQTAAADWNIDGTVAFGADTNIALWRPNVRGKKTMIVTGDCVLTAPE